MSSDRKYSGFPLAVRQRRQHPKEKMTVKNQNITFDKLDKDDQPPYELLLLADPSKDLVDEYLRHSDIYTARQNGQTLGVVVLFPLTPETVEIKNVAVKPEFQGQGIGSFLIENVVQVALLNRQKNICIGTANSSVGQLYLYQKLSFEITGIKRNFFIDNYTDPIFENGIQAKHMLVLTRQLFQKTILRKGQLTDLTELKQLFADTVTTICNADYNKQQIEVWTSGIDKKQRWEDIMTKQIVLVAQHTDKIVGFTTLDNGNYIDLLYVHKDHQRQGIAQQLLNGIETEARRLKQTTLTSDVSKTARPFFEKNDFKVLTEQIVNKKGIDLINYKMTKTLD